jgi:hypothetical protein
MAEAIKDRAQAGVRPPVRLQLSRKKGWRLPEGAVRVSRPGPFGNPWGVRDCAQMLDLTEHAARYQVIEWFKQWIALANNHESLSDLGHFSGTREAHATLHARMHELRGKDLACWCRADEPCHADVLLELANRPVCEAVPVSGRNLADATPKDPSPSSFLGREGR